MGFISTAAVRRNVVMRGMFMLTLLASSVALANDSGFSKDDTSWVNASDEEIKKSLEDFDLGSFDPNANRHIASMKEQAKQVAQDDPQMQRLKAQKKTRDTYSGHDTLLFASMSLENEGLEDMLAVAAEDPTVAIVFRGVPEGMRMDDGILFYQSLAKGYDNVPNITLDPSLFQKYDVDTVPTIITLTPQKENQAPDIPDAETLMEGDISDFEDDIMRSAEKRMDWERKVLGRVEGLTDPTWLERKLDRNETGDFGIKGPVAEIAEQDLTEFMKEKAAQIDWESKKEHALDNFWRLQRDNFHYLPTATRDRTRKIDATVVVTRDILDAKGNVLVPEGKRINPMDKVPFDMGIVVFDPMDKSQLEAALVSMRELEERDDIRRVILAAIRFDSDEGWEGFHATTDYFDRHVFLLQEDMKTRFELERTPSVITGDDSHFIVKELATKRAESDEDKEAVDAAMARMKETLKGRGVDDAR